MLSNRFNLERETGVGPATSTLARWRSTTELFPQNIEFCALINAVKLLERETGVGPATSTLARWRSTTELFPRIILRQFHARLELCERRDLNPQAEALDPKSSVYANFTTLAYNASVQIQMPGPQFFSLKNRLHETYVVRIYQNPQIVSSAL